MSDLNDLERKKFVSDSWLVSVDTTGALAWIDDIWSKDLSDLEKAKFEVDWTIRTVTAI